MKKSPGMPGLFCCPFCVASQSAVSSELQHQLSVVSVETEQGDDMEDDLVQRIASHPKYQQLKAKRSSFGWWLTLAMMVVYYGFILLVAFAKPLVSQRLGDGVMTLGIPLGFGVIVFTVAITAYYVKRANSEFDDLTDQITRGVLK
jgi:uncharacterized membrane protein (DUF485 family)